MFQNAQRLIYSPLYATLKYSQLKNINMKKLLLTLIAFTVLTAFGQTTDNYGWNKRIAFIVGGGSSIVSTELYNNPVVNKTNNFVTIEKASNIKPNLSLGIVYTPFVSNIERTVKVIKDGEIVEETFIEYYPRGITFGLFLNPISLSSVSTNSISNTVDIGLGIGWRSGNFSFLVTNEYFSIRQPREYFVEQFKDNNQAYIINGEVQNSIDINDNSIFKDKIAVSWGLKIAYTFDITKSFYTNSKNIATD